MCCALCLHFALCIVRCALCCVLCIVCCALCIVLCVVHAFPDVHKMPYISVSSFVCQSCEAELQHMFFFARL